MQAILNAVAAVTELYLDGTVGAAKAMAPRMAAVVNAVAAAVEEVREAIPHSNIGYALERGRRIQTEMQAITAPYRKAVEAAEKRLDQALCRLKATVRGAANDARDDFDMADEMDESDRGVRARGSDAAPGNWRKYARKSVGY